MKYDMFYTQFNIITRVVIAVATLFCSVNAIAAPLSPLLAPTPTSPLLQQAIKLAPQQAMTLAQRFVTEHNAAGDSQSTRDLAIAHQLIALGLVSQRQGDRALQQLEQAIVHSKRANALLVEAYAVFHRAVFTGVYQGRYEETETGLHNTLELLTQIQGTPDAEQLRLKLSSHHRLASLYFYIKKIHLAAPHMQQAKELAEQLGNIESQIKIALIEAKFSQHQQQGPDAEKSLLRASRLIQLIENPKLEGEVLQQSSRFYRHSQQFDLSLQYINRAVEIYQQHQMISAESVALNDMGIIYEEQGNDNLALVSYLNSLKLAERIPDKKPLPVGRTQHNIGVLYQTQHQDDKALSYLLAANNIFSQVQHPYFLMVNSHALAQLMFDTQQQQPALAYANKALELATNLNDDQHSYQSHQLLANIHEALADYPQAVHHYRQSLDWQQHQLARQRQKTSSGTSLQLEKLQQQLTDSKRQQYRLHRQLAQKEQQFHIAVGLSLLLGVMFISGYAHWRHLSLIRQQLAEHNLRHPVSQLPDLLRHWFDISPGQSVIKISQPASEVMLLLFDWPDYTALTARYGIDVGSLLQRQWIKAIQQELDAPLQHVSEQQFLLISPRTSTLPIAQRVTRLLALLERRMPTTLSPKNTPMPIAVALLDHEFFCRDKESITDKQRLALLNMTLWGARHLAQQHQQHSWVYLKAKPHAHSALLFGDIHKQGLLALNNHFFETLSNHPQSPIPWPLPE